MNAFQLWLLRMHIAALALVIPDLSKRLSITRLLALFTPHGESPRYAAFSQDEIVRAVEWRLRKTWRMRGRPCLRRGLLLFYFLRLAGIPAVMNFGVYRASGPHDRAHCWITVNGRCIADPPLQPYVLMLVHGNSPSTESETSRAAA